MMTIVETNVAAILAILVIWCTLVWALTYVYMSQKLEVMRNRLNDRLDVIEFMDKMFEEQEDTIAKQTLTIERLEGTIAKQEKAMSWMDEDIEYYVGMVLELENHIQLMERNA